MLPLRKFLGAAVPVEEAHVMALRIIPEARVVGPALVPSAAAAEAAAAAAAAAAHAEAVIVDPLRGMVSVLMLRKSYLLRKMV
jgi:hypothetical protein